tara:strand:+ start:653 stop:856 length:204 start_codon:yes stop_codon:yes gene_type:complete
MNTTISISKETKEEITRFGNKGETYDEILERVLKNARERKLQDFLMDEKDTLTVRNALDKAKERWQE